MLNSFLTKAKTTTKKYWKWILGVFIAVVIAYVAWKLKRQANQINALRADKLLFEMRARDLKMRAENERDAEAAQDLRSKAESYEAAAANKGTQIERLKTLVNEATENVKNAKDWQELEKQARGK